MLHNSLRDVLKDTLEDNLKDGKRPEAGDLADAIFDVIGIGEVVQDMRYGKALELIQLDLNYLP